MANTEHMIVVTGGPGSGKSSLIDAMAQRGFRTMPEAGRAIATIVASTRARTRPFRPELRQASSKRIGQRPPTTRLSGDSEGAE